VTVAKESRGLLVDTYNGVSPLWLASLHRCVFEWDREDFETLVHQERQDGQHWDSKSH